MKKHKKYWIGFSSLLLLLAVFNSSIFIDKVHAAANTKIVQGREWTVQSDPGYPVPSGNLNPPYNRKLNYSFTLTVAPTGTYGANSLSADNPLKAVFWINIDIPIDQTGQSTDFPSVINVTDGTLAGPQGCMQGHDLGVPAGTPGMKHYSCGLEGNMVYQQHTFPSNGGGWSSQIKFAINMPVSHSDSPRPIGVSAHAGEFNTQGVDGGCPASNVQTPEDIVRWQIDNTNNNTSYACDQAVYVVDGAYNDAQEPDGKPTGTFAFKCEDGKNKFFITGSDPDHSAGNHVQWEVRRKNSKSNTYTRVLGSTGDPATWTDENGIGGDIPQTSSFPTNRLYKVRLIDRDNGHAYDMDPAEYLLGECGINAQCPGPPAIWGKISDYATIVDQNGTDRKYYSIFVDGKVVNPDGQEVGTDGGFSWGTPAQALAAIGDGNAHTVTVKGYDKYNSGGNGKNSDLLDPTDGVSKVVGPFDCIDDLPQPNYGSPPGQEMLIDATCHSARFPNLQDPDAVNSPVSFDWGVYERNKDGSKGPAIPGVSGSGSGFGEIGIAFDPGQTTANYGVIVAANFYSIDPEGDPVGTHSSSAVSVARSCYSGTCSLSATVAGMPTNTVKEGQQFQLTATVTNTQDGNGNPLPVTWQGHQLEVSSTDSVVDNQFGFPGSSHVAIGGAAIPVGGASSGSVTLTAPAAGKYDFTAYTVWDNYMVVPKDQSVGSSGSDATGAFTCHFPNNWIKVDREFTIKPEAITTMRDIRGDPTTEDPKTVDYQAWVDNTGPANPAETVNVNLTGIEFYKQPRVGAKQLPDSKLNGKRDLPADKTYFLASAAGPNIYPTQPPPPATQVTIPQNEVQAGDQWCTTISAEFTHGWVFPGAPSDVAGTNEAGSPDDTNPAYPKKTGGGCQTVTNRSYFKVYGNSVSAGGSFKTAGDPANGVPADASCSGGGVFAGWFNDLYPNYYYGSSSEYSALAMLKVVGFASSQPVAKTTPNGLTFANTTPVTGDAYNPDVGGRFAGNKCLANEDPPNPNMAANWTATSDIPASGPAVLKQDTGNISIAQSGDVTLSAGSTAADTANVGIYDDDGDVYIEHNIVYSTAGWHYDPTDKTKNTIPSFVLRTHGNIYISGAVTQLDGLYIAAPKTDGTGGNIYTCGTAYAKVAAASVFDTCNNQLTIRGSFVANHVDMMRTYGTMRDESPNVVYPAGAAPTQGTQDILASGQTVPFYRYWCGGGTGGGQLGMHGYSQSPTLAGCTNPYEFVTGYILPTQTNGSVPLYYVQSSTGAGGDYFYSINKAEAASVSVSGEPVIVGYVWPAGTNVPGGTTRMYRFYDSAGHHFYSADPHEVDWAPVAHEGEAYDLSNSLGALGNPAIPGTPPKTYSPAGLIFNYNSVPSYTQSPQACPAGSNLVGDCHTTTQGGVSYNCVVMNEFGDATWRYNSAAAPYDDNYVCLPGSSSAHLAWTWWAGSGVDQATAKTTAPWNDAQRASLDSLKAAGYTNCIGPIVPAGGPQVADWGDNYLCSDQNLNLTFSNTGPLDPKSFYCTPIGDPGDPNYNTWWKNKMYICESIKPTVTAPASLDCSNKGTTSSTRPTCAAEVFDFSPELYFSNLKARTNETNGPTYNAITNLPPVL